MLYILDEQCINKKLPSYIRREGNTKKDRNTHFCEQSYNDDLTAYHQLQGILQVGKFNTSVNTRTQTLEIILAKDLYRSSSDIR